jgi:hypothetical protein
MVPALSGLPDAIDAIVVCLAADEDDFRFARWLTRRLALSPG